MSLGKAIHDEERNGRPIIRIDDLAEHVNAKVRENHHFTISDLFIEF